MNIIGYPTHDLSFLVDQEVTVVEPSTEKLLCDISIGDEIEIVDKEDLLPWLRGRVEWVSSVQLARVPRYITARWWVSYFNPELEFSEFVELLASYYGRPIPPDHEVSVLGVTVTEAGAPSYRLRIE